MTHGALLDEQRFIGAAGRAVLLRVGASVGLLLAIGGGAALTLRGAEPAHHSGKR
jgi:hypothetical protein